MEGEEGGWPGQGSQGPRQGKEEGYPARRPLQYTVQAGGEDLPGLSLRQMRQ